MQEKLILQVEVQNQQANAAFDRFETQMNDLRRETLSYRTALQSLNAELAENRQKLLTADAAAKDQLETRNRQIRAEQGLLRSRQQAASVNLATLQQERREFTKATEQTNKLSASFGKLAGAVGIAYGAMEAGRLADQAFRLGDRLEGVHRGLEQVYGSSERASERFAELNELAKLPGLDPQPLARYDAIFKNLGSTAEQNEILFTGVAKAITTFGGDVFGVNSALLQLSQGFSKNKIDMQDWKSVNEQTGGTIIKVAEEVLGFTGGIEGMQKAFKESGTTLQDFLMPVFVELNNRFQGAPVDSYTNRIDNLNVAWQNFIGEMTRGNRVVSGFLATLTGFLEGEADQWRNMDSAGEAIKAVGDASKVSAAEIVVLQKDLGRVNTVLEATKEKFQQLKDEGVNENAASMQQLGRRIEFLEKQSENLTGRVNTAKNAMQEMLKPTENINTEFRVLKTETETVDTRFMGLRERGVALKDTIAELPPELTRINELLPNTSVHADKLSEYFDTLKVSTVDLAAEQKALNLIYTEGISELNDYAPALNLVVGESNNVDPAIRRMATAARDMNVETKVMQDELRDNLVPTLSDVYASLDRTANEAMADLINKAGNAGTELDRLDGYLGNVYENLDKITNETDVPGVLTDISGAISNDLQYALRSMMSGGDLEVTLQDLGGNMGRSFVDGLINEWANEAVQPRINDAFGSLFSTLESSGVIAGAATLAGPVAVFAGAVAAFATAGEAWVDHFGGETRQEPIDDWMRLIAGASGLTLPGLQTNFGEWTGGALDFSHLVSATTGPTDEGAAALASRRYNLYQQLKSRTGATPQSEADRIAYESGMMSPEESAAYLAGYPEPTPSPSESDPSQATVSTEREQQRQQERASREAEMQADKLAKEQQRAEEREQARQDKLAREQARAEEKAAREAQRQEEKEQARQDRLAKEQARQQEQAEREAQRQEEREQAHQERIEKEQARAEEKAAREAQRQAEREQDRQDKLEKEERQRQERIEKEQQRAEEREQARQDKLAREQARAEEKAAREAQRQEEKEQARQDRLAKEQARAEEREQARQDKLAREQARAEEKASTRTTVTTGDTTFGNTSEPRTVVEKIAGLNLRRLDVMAEAVYIDTEKLGGRTLGELGGRGGGGTDAPIASGGIINTMEGRRTWGDIWAENPGMREEFYANFSRTKGLFDTDPLQAFVNQGTADADITADEALSQYSSAPTVVAKAVMLLQAYKNSGDVRLLNLLGSLSGSAHAEQREYLEKMFANAGLEHLLDQRMFHFPQTDRIAMMGGEQIVKSMLNSPTPTRTQMENAQDFTQNVVKGVENAMSGAMQGGMGQSVNVTVVVQLDRDQIITPEFTEQISDQMQWNQLDGINRR